MARDSRAFDGLSQLSAAGRRNRGQGFRAGASVCGLDALATALLRGAFEYQGQKCSAASRAYVPASLWPAVKARLADDLAAVHMGDVQDLSNFMGAVIDRKAYDRITRYIV
jgi:1-pyrroline-5-carboxylate dehydrogenase